jgi:hypothetical protein
MDAQTGKIEQTPDGDYIVKLPAELIAQLQVADGDAVDLIPTAMGVEVRKVGQVTSQFWDPFSETVNEYQRALAMIKAGELEATDDSTEK